MGSCASVHKDPDSAMKLRLSFGSKTGNAVTPSPVKDKPAVVAGGPTSAEVALKPRWLPAPDYRGLGHQEEDFFDSRPCFDSDFDDDFFSVTGDLTPSNGSSPVHRSSEVTFKVGDIFRVKIPELRSEPSPTNNTKKLSDLFKEGLTSDQGINEQEVLNKQDDRDESKSKAQALDLHSKSMNGTPCASATNALSLSVGETPNVGLELDEKSVKSAQCCLPRLLSNRSFSERKRRTSPAHNIG